MNFSPRPSRLIESSSVSSGPKVKNLVNGWPPFAPVTGVYSIATQATLFLSSIPSSSTRSISVCDLPSGPGALQT